MSKSNLGKIHVYTGDGHGKTTCALGVALRAIGHNFKVVVIQFMKGRQVGEFLAKEKLKPNLEIYQFGRGKLINKNRPQAEDRRKAAAGLKFAENVLKKQKPDILILDELNIAIDFNLLGIRKVLMFLKNYSHRGTEIICTGRNAKSELINRADLVTEMKKIKHYYDKGLEARRGIEF